MSQLKSSHTCIMAFKLLITSLRTVRKGLSEVGYTRTGSRLKAQGIRLKETYENKQDVLMISEHPLR